jgi:hypothetical protein
LRGADQAITELLTSAAYAIACTIVCATLTIGGVLTLG